MRSAGMVSCLLTVAMLGCAVDDLDLAGRHCPCVDGWVCDPATDLCVRGEVDASGPDAGSSDDAGPRDAGDSGSVPVDAGFDGGSTLDGGLDAGGGTDGGFDGGLDGGFDAGPDPTSCDDVHAGALFCESFEDGFASWPEVVTTGSGTAGRSSTRAYRGTWALRAESDTGLIHSAFARADVLPAMTSGDLWVRSYYYFPSGYTLSSLEFAGVADSSGDHQIVLSTYGADSDIHGHSIAGDMRSRVTRAVPRGAWVCVEQHVRFSDTDGVMEFWYDGTLVTSVTGVDTVTTGGLTVIEAGIVWQGDGQVPADVYVDEIVADTTRVGCD